MHIPIINGPNAPCTAFTQASEASIISFCFLVCQEKCTTYQIGTLLLPLLVLLKVSKALLKCIWIYIEFKIELLKSPPIKRE